MQTFKVFPLYRNTHIYLKPFAHSWKGSEIVLLWYLFETLVYSAARISGIVLLPRKHCRKHFGNNKKAHVFDADPLSKADCLQHESLNIPAQWTHNVEATSIQRWFNVLTLNQRWIDVVSTLCPCWAHLWEAALPWIRWTFGHHIVGRSSYCKTFSLSSAQSSYWSVRWL